MTPFIDDSLLPVLGAALDQTRSAACITTAQLDRPGPQIVYVNPAYCRMTGRTAEEVIGQTPRLMQGPLTDRAVLDRLRADLEAGRPFIGETVNYHKDGTPYLNSWRIDPVVDGDGAITHFIATQEDVTELRRAQRLLAAEKAIDRHLSVLVGGPTGTRANLDGLALAIRDAVAHLVDYGRAALVGSVRLGTAAAELAAGPGAADLRLTGESISPDGTATVGRADDRFWIGCSLASERAGIAGAVAVLDLTAAELDFVDRAGLERVAECARRALESLAEYERQRLVAIELQRGLLPAGEPRGTGLRVSARYQPAAFASRVGGDWYDVITMGDRVIFVVGDMTGSGIRAAADMGRVRLLIRALLGQGFDVPEVFAQLNRFCGEEDLLATALAITADPSTGSLTVVAAGHPPPVLRRSAGAEVVDVAPGPLLGIGGEVQYPERSLVIEPDELVVMFTDGLVERRTEPIDRSLGRLADRLAELPADPEVAVARLLGDSLADDPVDEGTDDIAIVAFALGHPAGS